MEWQNTPCTAFEGSRCLGVGELKNVALLAKAAIDQSVHSSTPPAVLIFNDATSEVVELDWRGSVEQFNARFEARALAMAPAGASYPRVDSAELPAVAEPPLVDAAPPSPEAVRGPGRPKLGVVAREVTLLPRHWEWLGNQPGGASVALRKLVEVARRSSETKDRVRQASEVGYKFMSIMAGHEPGFEEASRSLFAGDQAGFEAIIATWSVDVKTHLTKILADAFSA
ncbi:MAG: DUF2239 family protein [Rhizobacter sp.]|nr:DUF2239 family protein [Burkholderiales bacterium]